LKDTYQNQNVSSGNAAIAAKSILAKKRKKSQGKKRLNPLLKWFTLSLRPYLPPKP